MSRARALAVAVLLVSYGAVGARQPAVRAAVPLPVPAHVIAAAAGLPSSDPSTLLLHIIRLVFDSPDSGTARRTAIRNALRTPDEKTADVVPLPLDPAIWRETILQQQIPDRELVAAILSDRRAALLYYGLAALDDETLAWLGPDRETLLHVRQQSALFATFGRSIHVRGGRVLVPGGSEAEGLWTNLTGVDPGRPAAFVQRIFRDANGQLAHLYDAVAHLDTSRQRFALGLHLPESSRDDRLRALLGAFTDSRWQPSVHPFSRPQLDPSVLLSTIAVNGDGEAAGPMVRRIWERVFHDDGTIDVPFTPVETGEAARDVEATPIDAAWLAARTSRVPQALGRRRLNTVLFAQRVFGAGRPADPAVIATALRGFASFPALMLTLERIGTTQASTFARAAQHAARLGAIESVPLRRTTIAGYQSALGIVERAQRSGVVTSISAQSLANSLAALEVSADRGYEARLAEWLHEELLRTLPPAPASTNPAEAAILAAIAGVGASIESAPVAEWKGARYLVDPAGAELRRLSRVREHQGGPSLDAALAAATRYGTELDRPGRKAGDTDRVLADTLASILYAAYLGDPEGSAVTSGNVALRHDFGFPVSSSALSQAAWQLPEEDSGAKGGWRIRGSLLGLDFAVARLALRRLDPRGMGSEPELSASDRQTVALMNPVAATDNARDEIAAALARGRARASALTADPAHLDQVARAAGLSEWRRQALGWTVEHDPGAAVSQFSLLELLWLGGPRPSAIQSLDAWGAAALPLTGCLCLKMPGTESFPLRSATQVVNLSLQIADALASLRLPAALAPAIVSFAAQDARDRAQPEYADWREFGQPARMPSRDRLMSYIGALTANGPLLPPQQAQNPRRGLRGSASPATASR
jgi:hypothetical protein